MQVRVRLYTSVCVHVSVCVCVWRDIVEIDWLLDVVEIEILRAYNSIVQNTYFLRTYT